MKTGQRVRFRQGLKIGDITIPKDAAGVVVCSYKLLADRSGRERVDVDFRPYGILWAQPAEAFETTSENQVQPAA